MDDIRQILNIIQEISQRPNVPINQAQWEPINPNNLAEWAMEERGNQDTEQQRGTELENWKHMIANWLGNPSPRAWPAYGSPELDAYRELLDGLQRPPQPVPMPSAAPVWRQQ